MSKLSLEFKIVTEYEDTDYKDEYSPENTKTAGSLDLDADGGKSYQIIITGDKTNGYKAALQ
ncbi:MAG: hypothetical protein PUB87_05050 [Eubacteriaceae bacterium]|nr:hypothetical protein [Eubacteriaceae bacterium]